MYSSNTLYIYHSRLALSYGQEIWIIVGRCGSPRVLEVPDKSTYTRTNLFFIIPFLLSTVEGPFSHRGTFPMDSSYSNWPL